MLCVKQSFVVSSSSFYVQGVITFYNFQGLLSFTLFPSACVWGRGAMHS